ncbi:unnamed protein product [Phytophthora fragariaefolia]|uniref:Unnamed protein product n=1 Tax=Phytophthora fragariaefolia TaxID=1490495 RepID=A0A9W6XIM9_9STRA|nr:unnamed protein product [Phytophthora fragariaefolia]
MEEGRITPDLHLGRRAGLKACPEDAYEVGADTAAVPEALADRPEASVIGSADLANLPDLAVPLAVLVADLAALLDLAVGRALLADLAPGRGGLDDLTEALARAFLVDIGVTGEDDPVIEGAGATVEVDFGDAADLRGARGDVPAAALVGDLRADLDVDPAEALVACGEVRRVDGGAELAEPAETAGRGRAVDYGAEVTIIEETKPAELVAGAADAADPERGTELDAETCTDGRVTGVRWSRRNGLPWTRRGSADGTWKSAGVIANSAADELEVGAAELSGKETGAELGAMGPLTRSVISRTSLGWTWDNSGRRASRRRHSRALRARSPGESPGASIPAASARARAGSATEIRPNAQSGPPDEITAVPSCICSKYEEATPWSAEYKTSRSANTSDMRLRSLSRWSTIRRRWSTSC